MKDPLEDYNLDFDDYPNWRKGLIVGFIGGLVSSLCICTPLFLVISRLKDKEEGLSLINFTFGVFIFGFLIFGSYAAFRPPFKK